MQPLAHPPSTSTSTSPPLLSLSPSPSPSTSSTTSTSSYKGPITAQNLPISDATLHWEQTTRSTWKSRLPSTDKPRKDKDVAVEKKLKILERMLNRNSNGLGLGGEKGKGKEVEAEGEGEDIGEDEDDEEGIDRIGEGILSSFRQGRALRNPVPLSIVVSLFYQSWLKDGTIPKDYLTNNSSYNSDGLKPSQPASIPAPAPALARPPKLFGRESITRRKDLKR